MVKLILNLAFLPEERARKFQFSVDGCLGQYQSNFEPRAGSPFRDGSSTPV
jgi:hypothetical protein